MVRVRVRVRARVSVRVRILRHRSSCRPMRRTSGAWGSRRSYGTHLVRVRVRVRATARVGV